MGQLEAAAGIIDNVTGMVGDNIYSDQERAAERTNRLQIDSTSPFRLPHLIRPYSFLWAMANETILTSATIFVAFFVKDADPNATNTLMAALAANTAVLSTIVGFYFNSRRNEKINAKKSLAAIQLQKDKGKIEIAREKMKLEEERKTNREERRERRRNN